MQILLRSNLVWKGLEPWLLAAHAVQDFGPLSPVPVLPSQPLILQKARCKPRWALGTWGACSTRAPGLSWAACEPRGALIRSPGWVRHVLWKKHTYKTGCDSSKGLFVCLRFIG